MITLDAKIAFLLQPASYPEHVYRIETVETHMSWIFLTEQHAYKLKKPVDYGIPDFSTIEARRFFCEEEVRLNRRLTTDVYIATLPLVVNTSGHLEIAGPGPAVDWLVKMRRLPVQRMLAMTADEIAQRSERLAGAIARIGGWRAEIMAGASAIGGGSGPGIDLPTWLIAIHKNGLTPAALSARLRTLSPPIVARIEHERVLLDLRTVLPDEDTELAALLATV